MRDAGILLIVVVFSLVALYFRELTAKCKAFYEVVTNNPILASFFASATFEVIKWLSHLFHNMFV